MQRGAVFSRVVVAVLVVGIAAVQPTAADATNASCPTPTIEYVSNAQNPSCYEWQGDWEYETVSIPSRSPGLTYAGTVFAPADRAAYPGVRPGVVLVHGAGSKEYSLWWAARALAGHGYVVLTLTVGGSRDPDFVTAVQSAGDFLGTPANPFAARVDANNVGVGGHSQGARAASYVPQLEPRFKAIVAFDNLASNLAGDDGTPLLAPECNTGTSVSQSHPVVPTVPALGIASDQRATTCAWNGEPEQKKTAYAAWRAAGVPVMQLVPRGSNHLSFAHVSALTPPDWEAGFQLFSYYAIAWFDRFLVSDGTADARLLADPVLGLPRADRLSTQFRSAVFLPHRAVDCGDLALCTFDVVPPETSIEVGPATPTTSIQATFTFSGHDEDSPDGMGFECALDAAEFAACASPITYDGLQPGPHLFRVRAVDGSFNVDETPASHAWTIEIPPDTAPPGTTITLAPASPTSVTRAAFAFEGNDNLTQTDALRFECSLDGEPFSSCTSPQSYAGLAAGHHTFAVQSVDEAGNVDPSPAAVAWDVTFAFAGFLSPAAPAPGDTTAHAGRAFPMKWRLALDGSSVTQVATVRTVGSSPCGSDSLIPGDPTAVTYDAAAGHFVYHFRIPATPGCWEFRLGLTDSTTHVARFNVTL